MDLTCQTKPRLRDRANRGWLVLLLLAGLNLVPRALSAEPTVSETDIKAGFIYNAAKFTEWPAKAFSNENSPINLMVLGDEDFASRLATILKDKKAHGRSFQVKRITNSAEAKSAHILFVPSGETRRFAQLYETIKKSPVLTIGESGQFLDAGGMINLIIENELLQFEIHPEALESSSLVISSRVMRLAKTIKRGEVKK
jgi:hypothetical protein